MSRTPATPCCCPPTAWRPRSTGSNADDADHLSAIASGLFSIARSAAAKFGGSDGVRQVVAELDDTLLFVSSAGFGSVLTVLADREADAGVLGYEMVQLVKSVRPFLATPARQPGAPARADGWTGEPEPTG